MLPPIPNTVRSSIITHERDDTVIVNIGPSHPATHGTVQIIADQRTPFRTLAEVLYTMGQAEFQHIHFVVLEEASHNR